MKYFKISEIYNMVHTFIMTGTKSDFTTKYSPTIHLDPHKKYEVALLSVDLFNSIPNVTSKNNVFKYSVNNGNTWKTIELATGAYELSAINLELQRLLTERGDFDNTFSITPNISKLTSIIEITKPQFKIDFGVANSIGTVLGFGNDVITQGYNESPKIVNIIQINSILINTDIISGSYVNGSQYSTIYSFYPNVAPGFKVVERPVPSLTFFPLSRSNIESIRIFLTDQDLNPIDLRGETITVRLSMREIKDIKQQFIDAMKELKKENFI